MYLVKNSDRLIMKKHNSLGVPDSPYCMEYTVAEDDVSNPPSGRSSPELPLHRSSGAKLMFSTTKVCEKFVFSLLFYMRQAQQTSYILGSALLDYRKLWQS